MTALNASNQSIWSITTQRDVNLFWMKTVITVRKSLTAVKKSILLWDLTVSLKNQMIKHIFIIFSNILECYYNGSKFKVGEKVPVDNPCRICQCGYGFNHEYTLQYSTPFTTVHCITIECPEHFGVHRFPLVPLQADFDNIHNCYNVYQPNKCCAVSKKCLGIDNWLTSELEINWIFVLRYR